IAGHLALGLDLLEDRGLLQLETNVDGNGHQQERHQERNAPSPRVEHLAAEIRARGDDHGQRHDDAERRRGLEPDGVVAAGGLGARRVWWPGSGTERCSRKRVMHPPYSPPRHRPWIMRRPNRMNAAVRPICSNVGIRPMQPVPTPMPVSVTRKVYLRPTRSPIQPNRNAPNGRIRKPAVNSAIVLRRAATGWDFSKNLTDRIAAKLPKM